MNTMKKFTEGIDKIYSDLDGVNETFTPDFMLGRVHRTLKHLVQTIDPEGEDPLGSTFGVIKDLIRDIETKTQVGDLDDYEVGRGEPNLTDRERTSFTTPGVKQ